MDNGRQTINYHYQELLHTPEGVWDHYGKDCREYKHLAAALMGVLHRYGYEDIKTPTFEFFDVFSREVGTTASRELYKFFDKEGNTLVLRPDFTPSVARCAAKYFMDDTQPLRFCYEGSAFVNSSSLQGKLRESTQLGAELINDDSAYADAEMIAMLVDALLSSGLTRFQITVGNVEYYKGLCEAAGIDEETKSDLREFLSGKNYYAAEDLLKSRGIAADHRERFLQITNFMKGDTELREMLEAAPGPRAGEAISRLMEVCRLLKACGYDRYISFDLSLLSRYRYYTGVIFKGYTYGVGDAIATGGRYDSLLAHFGKDAAAIGFMIGLDTLIEAVRVQHIPAGGEEAGPKILTFTDDDYAEVLQEAQRLRKAGETVVLQKAKEV